jgi:RNA polymerase sigma factor (sigma-70 family)
MHHDHQYIEALRRNDPHMIRDIYRQHAGAVQRWVQSRGGSVEEARDIFQDALIALFEKAQQVDFVLTCPLGALLHVICSRKYIDRLRQKNKDAGVRNEEERRYTETYDSDALTLAEEAMAAQEKQLVLADAFAQLSDLCRRLLTLLSNGVTPKDAAAALEMNGVDTLYRRKNACTERWRELVLARA